MLPWECCMKRELKRWLWTPAALRDCFTTVVHFHHSDDSTFWQEITTLKTNTCKQSFHHKCLQISQPSSIKRPDHFKVPSPFPPKLSQKTKFFRKHQRKTSILHIYSISYCSSWHKPSRPVKGSGWRQTASSANYQTWGSHKQNQRSNLEWF